MVVNMTNKTFERPMEVDHAAQEVDYSERMRQKAKGDLRVAIECKEQMRQNSEKNQQET